MNKTSANKMKKIYINTATKTHSSVHLVLNRVLSFTFPVFTISNVLFSSFVTDSCYHHLNLS